jgi:hypothetical protein
VSSFEGAIHRALLQPEVVTIGPGSEARFRIEIAIRRPEKGNILTGKLFAGTELEEARSIGLRCMIKIDNME